MLNPPRCPAQFLTQHLPVPADFAEGSIGARLPKSRRVFYALDVVQFDGQRLGQNTVATQARRRENFVYLIDNFCVVRSPFLARVSANSGHGPLLILLLPVSFEFRERQRVIASSGKTSSLSATDYEKYRLARQRCRFRELKEGAAQF